jgi:cation diffusion facilitator CzcD-associated flavoprotein CzcO
VRHHRIAIIGAGFAGLGMAIRLRQEGVDDFVVLERAPSLGGVWRDNRYPGVACDVPAHLYSYSFEPNPRWTRFFAPQREILAYLERCADKYDVRRHIRFGAGVQALVFDEDRQVWTITTEGGSVFEADVVVCASGLALTQPKLPPITGLDTFEGSLFHSSRWNQDEPLDGRRVAVVGTGASAIQIVPAIAPRVGRLTVFQRTAPWVVARPDHEIGPRAQGLFERHPAAQKVLRGAIYTLLETFAVGFVVDPRVNRARQALALRFLAKSVADPALRAKLTPTFTLGCKRVLFSSDYLPALQRPNVELVTERIARIEGSEIVTEDGARREVDAIVCATGFEAADAQLAFDVVGRSGRSLRDAWSREGASAYLGCSVAGFPNFFMLIGPNTGLGHSSMIYMMESQMAYVLDALAQMRAADLATLEVRREAQERYNARLQERLAKTVWMTGGCASWYVSQSGKNTTLWPGFTWEFRLRTRRFDRDAYALEPRRQRKKTTRSTSVS